MESLGGAAGLWQGGGEGRGREKQRYRHQQPRELSALNKAGGPLAAALSWSKRHDKQPSPEVLCAQATHWHICCCEACCNTVERKVTTYRVATSVLDKLFDQVASKWSGTCLGLKPSHEGVSMTVHDAEKVAE
ncbi:hypothetical protein HaLaN_27238 [Haematococcus lacustris]|uniref:Uncharacterized protein n=1 Tax=Haematococcus lacustris TaxID=44745 RepID=A0A6A0A8B5_HAELA|nr:hypothetical protein HaLaN_27238 [Haematococcus lacustris]